jgi:hypothetical protein
LPAVWAVVADTPPAAKPSKETTYRQPTTRIDMPSQRHIRVKVMPQFYHERLVRRDV